MNKEHVFPQWLIARCDTANTRIPWGRGRRVFPRSATFPLCTDCNRDFGTELEGPVQRIFTVLESGEAITDEQAELLIRWLWKIQGLTWIATHAGGVYTDRYRLRERVLNPIDEVRGDLVLAVARIAGLDPGSTDSPMGINTYTHIDAIFAACVMSRLALVVTLAPFAQYLPDQFRHYRLTSIRDGNVKAVVAPVTFVDDVEAVAITDLVGRELSRLHDELALLAQRRHNAREE
jgi:hypothetical protein